MRASSGALAAGTEVGDSSELPPEDDPIELPIDGTLDLHCFAPADVKLLLPDYLEACRERGILEVRIVHGKGRGVLCRTVRAALARLPYVQGIRSADTTGGGWGATLVELDPQDADSSAGGTDTTKP